MTKRVCIIGAGFSGLTAIKCCLDENLTPVCYEKGNDIGGLWNYQESEKDAACVYKSTIINTSKEMMAFSDFPIPKEFANFMHNKKLMEYARLYATEFNLLDHIQFGVEVLSCALASDHEMTGKWNVRVKSGEGERTEIFDALLVCTGHHATPHYPLHEFPGFEKFGGFTVHSHSYREPKNFEDKRVVVIGIGNSGGDIAVELSKHAQQVFLSTRRGAWVLNRVGPKGVPLDYAFTSRFATMLKDNLPFSWSNYFQESILNNRFDHAKYGLKPKHRFFSQHPMVNDSLPNSILSGSVKMKCNVAEFTENGVVFEDGSSEEVDGVIFATGYTFGFPFFDESIIKVTRNHCKLYKHMWPPALTKANMAVIGGIQPFGAINPISEIQCRWATKVFKGDLLLPSPSSMAEDINQTTYEMNQQFYSSQRHTIQVDYVNYMDTIAEKIGAKPNVIKLFLTDPKLASMVAFAGCTPFQYRLTGPGAWQLARETILSQRYRVDFPLSTRNMEPDKPSGWSWLLVSLVVVFLGWFVLHYLNG
ncbi:flavin-containing monooxygenase 5-like isoform X1 [Clavelina lepadiformis]|uniref:flavin-containing monooxygenase 5-like isoform X1 n=1 Tax=Clavelina lepadiformis TaxID=159417 RepID=UPI004042A8DE